MRPLLFATCSAFPDGADDDRLLVDALAASNVAAAFAVWNDPSVDWTHATTVLRSTWDYTLRRSAFLDWAHALPALHNPAALVAWNSDKVYLHELADAGVAVTPTTVVPPGSEPTFPSDTEFVVKPSVGAGSRGAGRFSPPAANAAAVHVRSLHDAGRTVLIQPYLAGVDDAGETALIYADGDFSHAIRKGPMLTGGVAHDIAETSGLYVEENIASRDPSPDELSLGAQALAFLRSRFGSTPLYARVDLLPTPSGPVVIELELTEPSLFLDQADGAVERMAAAIAARL
ncbi:MAG: ATP-grasp domain-containing protein [Jatrophihabitantaceae bacterium]